jgi:galactose-1-phosphate uridylyltransferase
VQLRSERFVATFLDPRRKFEPVDTLLEVRVDPLTGQSCRLLPPGSIPPPARHDLAALAEQSRTGCPFCGDALERETPRFPPAVCADGRFRCGEAVLFPNLVPYSKWSSVSVYSPNRHLIAIDELGPPLLADNLITQVEFARAVVAHDPSAAWISINANQLPPSGSSIFHPHLQGAASPVPSTMQRLLADADVHAYVELERDGERWIGSHGGVDWLASFAPVGPAEVRGFVRGVGSTVELERDLVDELARGIAAVLRAYAGLGYESFNLALCGAGGDALLVRIVARAYIGPLLRSDVMWSERLHWEAATDVAPEHVAELARE